MSTFLAVCTILFARQAEWKRITTQYVNVFCVLSLLYASAKQAGRLQLRLVLDSGIPIAGEHEQSEHDLYAMSNLR